MLAPELKNGKYIFVARVSAKSATHEVLKQEMSTLLKRAELFQQEVKA